MQFRADVKGQGVCRSEAMQRSDLYKRCVRHQFYRIKEIQTKEKQFLIDFFNATRGHNWKVKFGWIGQKKTISKPELKLLAAFGAQFHGISSSEGRLIGINLAGNGCKGVIPSTISQINQCKFLKLNWNRIRGSIPKNLSKLTELEDLSLFANALEGTIDSRTIEALSNLQILNLSFNKLSGSIPDAFDDTIHLRHLNLAGNKLSGTLPRSMRNLRNLELLHLYSNEFCGEIPEWIEEFTCLQDVNLSQNKYKFEYIFFTNLTHCILGSQDL